MLASQRARIQPTDARLHLGITAFDLVDVVAELLAWGRGPRCCPSVLAGLFFSSLLLTCPACSMTQLPPIRTLLRHLCYRGNACKTLFHKPRSAAVISLGSGGCFLGSFRDSRPIRGSFWGLLSPRCRPGPNDSEICRDSLPLLAPPPFSMSPPTRSHTSGSDWSAAARPRPISTTVIGHSPMARPAFPVLPSEVRKDGGKKKRKKRIPPLHGPVL